MVSFMFLQFQVRFKLIISPTNIFYKEHILININLISYVYFLNEDTNIKIETIKNGIFKLVQNNEYKEYFNPYTED